MFKVEKVTFKYPNSNEDTIKGISFEVKEGEIFGLLGPSGVGKSTTQKILIKILEDYNGKILYKNKDLKAYDKNFYQQIGVGFEMPVHFSKLTGAENIDFFKMLYKNNADTDELLKKVGLYKDKDKLVSQYSKGMKVRLNFVRALLNNPQILFLDEPTNGLDPKNARIIKQIIKDFRKKGGTVILTTHLMGDADELCDRVAFMADGKIVEINTPKKLKLKYGERLVDIEYETTKEIAKKTFCMDDLGNNNGFIELMKKKKIITIHSRETTLDEIFIEVTGVKTNE